jgi:YVTN family beta-propeller protein
VVRRSCAPGSRRRKITLKSEFLIRAIVAIGLLVSAAQAQWLDTTIGVGSYPCDLVYDSADNKAYCANWEGHSVTVIDGASNQVIATVQAGSDPWTLCYNPQDNKV